MTHAGADAVAAGIATADDDDVFALGIDELAIAMIAVEQALSVGGEELHRKVDAFELAARDWQIARLGRAGREQQGVVIVDELLRIDVLANIRAGHELDPFLAEDVHAALDDAFIELHVGDAIHQQTADTIGPLI